MVLKKLGFAGAYRIDAEPEGLGGVIVGAHGGLGAALQVEVVHMRDCATALASVGVIEDVDGLQRLMKDQIWLDLPWTYADWEQANRRLVRRGSPYQGRQRILVPDTPWNRKVMDVIEGRKTLDDIIKEKQLG